MYVFLVENKHFQGENQNNHFFNFSLKFFETKNGFLDILRNYFLLQDVIFTPKMSFLNQKFSFLARIYGENSIFERFFI